MEACSHHSCSYGINYDRLSMINELIPIICFAVYVCVCVCARICNLLLRSDFINTYSLASIIICP